MRNNFHGSSRKHAFFEGWYFKQQNKAHTIAVIPAFHMDEEGIRSASVQVITERGSFYIPYPAEDFQADKKKCWIRVGESLFTDCGLRLNLNTEGLELKGNLQFGSFTAPEKDIMGPFRWAPNLQCNHQVLSLSHSVTGKLSYNGKVLDFADNTGYVEKDWGRSFPESYVWTQSNFGNRGRNCIMISAATIPMPFFSFNGCICAVCYEGKQYRLGTYLGARIVYRTEREVCIAQGRMKIRAELLEKHIRPLQAPDHGRMSRTIHETVSGIVRYEMFNGAQRVFEVVCDMAGYEYAADERRESNRKIVGKQMSIML